MKKLIILLLSIGKVAYSEIAVTNYAYNNSATNHYKPINSNIYQQNISGACWTKAEQTYGIPAKLLVAIAKVETGLKPHIISKPNKDGSYDIGLMQINSNWLPTLAKYNLNQNDLLKPCTNIMVGAWILSNNIQKLGYNWNAVGAYNAKSIQKRSLYAKKVHQAIIELGYNN